MSLTISQSENTTENNVAAKVVETLYNLSQSQTPPTTLVGSISLSSPTYQVYVDSLTTDYPHLHITASAYYALFEDSIAQQICATNWGSNGGVTTAQLAAVSTIDENSGFKANSNIVKFNEFSYFTGINNIGSQAFRDCTALEEITIPNTVTKINSQAFRWCTSLKTISPTPLSSVTDVRDRAFYQCKELEGALEFPNLTYCYFGSNGSAFHECKKINKLLLGHITNAYVGNAYDADQRGISKCDALKIVDFGDSLTTYGGYMFKDCGSVKAILFRGSTPPTVTYTGDWDTWANSTSIVYVPSAALSTYQTTSGFDTLNSAGRLKTIENDYNESTILAS